MENIFKILELADFNQTLLKFHDLFKRKKQTIRYFWRYSIILWKRGHSKGAYCFANVGRYMYVGRYVGQSICRPSVVRSISFDPFTWSIPNLVQGLPSMRRWSLLNVQFTCSKVKVKPLFSAHCVVYFIYFEPLLACFGQVLLLERR